MSSNYDKQRVSIALGIGTRTRGW